MSDKCESCETDFKSNPCLTCPDLHTDPSTLPEDVKKKLILARDALIKKDFNEAYHQLYSIADPIFTSYDPWVKLEGRG